MIVFHADIYVVSRRNSVWGGVLQHNSVSTIQLESWTCEVKDATTLTRSCRLTLHRILAQTMLESLPSQHQMQLREEIIPYYKWNTCPTQTKYSYVHVCGEKVKVLFSLTTWMNNPWVPTCKCFKLVLNTHGYIYIHGSLNTTSSTQHHMNFALFTVLLTHFCYNCLFTSRARAVCPAGPIAIFELVCPSVTVWGGLGTSQWRTAGMVWVIWFVRLLAAKGSQALPVRSTIDSRGTQSRKSSRSGAANYKPDEVRNCNGVTVLHVL